MITREIVASYGGVCQLLAKRRNAEQILAAIRKQLNSSMTFGGPCGYGSGPRIEKVRGLGEYAIAPRGTNNPDGAALQREDGYREALERQEQVQERVLIDAEELISEVQDGTDQAILRYYCCCRVSDERIGPLVGYEKSTVNEHRNKAICELEMKFRTKAEVSGR